MECNLRCLRLKTFEAESEATRADTDIAKAEETWFCFPRERSDVFTTAQSWACSINFGSDPAQSDRWISCHVHCIHQPVSTNDGIHELGGNLPVGVKIIVRTW